MGPNYSHAPWYLFECPMQIHTKTVLLHISWCKGLNCDHDDRGLVRWAIWIVWTDCCSNAHYYVITSTANYEWTDTISLQTNQTTFQFIFNSCRLMVLVCFRCWKCHVHSVPHASLPVHFFQWFHGTWLNLHVGTADLWIQVFLCWHIEVRWIFGMFNNS